MTNNHQQAKSSLWMDKALEGQPAETKARVLEIILKYGIDPDNEFFVIFVALGQLQVLIEDSPQDWQDLFLNFQGELEQWSQTNLKTLELLVQKAQTTEQLAMTCKSLVSVLTKLVNVSTTLIGRLQKSDQNYSASLSKLTASSNNWESMLAELKSQQERMTIMLQNKIQATPSNRPWLAFLPWLVTWVLVLGGLGLLFSQQGQNAQTIQWLLYKANRLECRSGIKPADSLECRGL